MKGLLAAAAMLLWLAAFSGRALTGTMQDVRHVVILMQENRSFDHYYGSLGGVRGLNDRNVLFLTNGNSDLFQPVPGGYVLPFHMPAPCIDDVDHGEESGLDAWDLGNWDLWAPSKGARTMGYYTRSDMPFHYALADAYTICDNNFCSFIGPTFPNRLYLFTGTIDPNGTAGGPVLANNNIPTQGLSWTTYPERLQAAGVSWKVYRPAGDWFGDALMWFAPFMSARPGNPLYDRGMATVSNQVAALAADVTNGTLPGVSWIIPTIAQSEHPSAAPYSGEVFIQQVLAALSADTNVFDSTVLIITYDENGGFFDHIPAPVAPPGTADEFVNGQPIGPGIRVPMLLISPWTRGGRVCSQLFDHTSIIRFLETWTGVQEPTISAWRRQVCGDLTSAFDFANPDFSVPALPAIPPPGNMTIVDPAVPSPQSFPTQETAVKAACPLPYQPDAMAAADCASNQLDLTLTNGGTASVHFSIYAMAGQSGFPQQADVCAGGAAGSSLAVPPSAGGAYDFACYGPNGFQRRFAGSLAADCGQCEVSSAIDGGAGTLTLSLFNGTASNLNFTITDGYGANAPVTVAAPAGSAVASVLTPVNGWYDVAVTTSGDASFLRLLAGHIENGAFSTTDVPAMVTNFPPNAPVVTNGPVAAQNAPSRLPVTPPGVSFLAMVSNLVANNPAPAGTNNPALLAAASVGNVALLYPVWASNYMLQFSPNLAPNSWTALSVTSSVLGNYNFITQPATNGAAFYRLAQ